MSAAPASRARTMPRLDGTIAIVAAAPGAALAPLVAECRQAGPTEVWAPLAAPPWLARAPGVVGRYAARRQLPAALSRPQATARPDGLAVLGVDAALRAWARDRTDRRYLADFLLRGAIDAWAAAEVRRHRPRIVIAGSLAARRTFAAARTVGAKAVLVLDLPILRALHDDLDRAAATWPERTFLRRFRAPSWAIARQEAERVLADLVLVRGPYAYARCLADGIPEARLARLPHPPPRVVPAPAAPTNRLRLAGLAAARHGIDTALVAARALGATLVVRTGEGSEPADLARRPGVAVDDGPVDAIICPAVCETYAPELRVLGIPVIASPMASLDGGGPDPYDAGAFARAIASAPAATAPAPIAALAPRLVALGSP